MPWFIEKKDDEFCIRKGTKEAPLDEVACHPTRDAATAQMRALYASEAKAIPGNHLKALYETDTHLVVGNYMILFGGRDLTAAPSPDFYTGEPNADGSTGESFSKSTVLDSAYTNTGHLLMDWEHGRGKKLDGIDAPGRDDIIGVVNWKSAEVDDTGIWVTRALNRRSKYLEWIKTLIAADMVGTSTEAIAGQVEKKANGEITRWPLKRDTFTFTPMEHRMMTENVLQAAKALGLYTEPEPQEPEAQPEAADNTAAVEAAKVEQAQIELELSFMEA